jgi:membrane protease YdiL (CAAX protease family)
MGMENFKAIIISILLVSLLFLGPLYVYSEEYKIINFQRNSIIDIPKLLMIIKSILKWIYDRILLKKMDYNDYFVYRSYIIGPLTEEITFRACMCNILYNEGFTIYSTMLISSLLFGIAHCHQ